METLKTQFVFRAHTIDPDQTLAALFVKLPESLPFLIRLGFTPLASSLTRESLTRRVTVRQAAETLPINVERLLVDLERLDRSHRLESLTGSLVD